MTLEYSTEFFLNLNKDTIKRFDQSKFMRLVENAYDPLTSNLMNSLQSLKNAGSYTIRGEDGRPDLISFRIYEDEQYWWLLMEYNQVIDPNDIKTGDVWVYPSIDNIEDLYFSLKSKETAII